MRKRKKRVENRESAEETGDETKKPMTLMVFCLVLRVLRHGLVLRRTALGKKGDPE
jgi:hypothetical protein